ARLMRTLGVATADELRARSVADIGAFWDTVTRDLGIEFRTPYSQVVDLTRGTEYPEWFSGGTINIVDAALGRWKDATPGATADGTTRRRRTVLLKPQLDEALKACPDVEVVAVVDNVGEAVTLEPGRDVEWAELLAADPDLEIEPTSASDVLLLAYTSGTTG